MNKTKLGISTALLASLAYFTAAFGGYPATLLVCGYILLFETGSRLKKSAVTALILMVFFTGVTVFIGVFGISSLSISSMATSLNTSIARGYTVIVFLLNFIPKAILSILGIRELVHKEKTVENHEKTM